MIPGHHVTISLNKMKILKNWFFFVYFDFTTLELYLCISRCVNLNGKFARLARIMYSKKPLILFFYPIFLQTDAIRALSGEKMHTMQLMVEQERRNVEQLRQDLAGSYSSKIQQEHDTAIKRLAKLESQLSDFKKVRIFHVLQCMNEK